ncbi:MAG: tetratricopeptide repeat protein [Bacteroidota bacterium]
MELLRKIKILLIAFVLSINSINLIAQDYSNTIKAFEESYTLENQGKYSQAINKLKDVYDENSYEINLRLGWLNYQLGLFTESMSNYQKALNLMPYSEEAKFGLILPKSAIGKWQEVITLYNEILVNSPNNTVANYRLGLIYYGQKDYQKAFNYFKKVVSLYPFNYDALIMLAWSNYQLGKLREAKILFNKVLMLSPNDKSALEGLGLIK